MSNKWQLTSIYLGGQLLVDHPLAMVHSLHRFALVLLLPCIREVGGWRFIVVGVGDGDCLGGSSGMLKRVRKD